MMARPKVVRRKPPAGARAAQPPPRDQLFRQLVEGVSDYAIFFLSPDGIISTWNTGALRIKRYTADEAIGRHFSMFYTPEDQARGVPQQALQTALREGKYEAEGWRVRKGGSHFWASVVIDRLSDENGTLLGFAKLTRDLTQRRAEQEALRESEERFGILVQGVTDYAIYMLDPEGRITNWNAGGERIKGYSPAEVLNRHFSLFYTDEDRAMELPRRALTTAERDGRYEAEGLRVRKDGTTFWAGVVIDAIRDNDGKLVGFAKVTRDLTERRATEDRLRQAQKMEAIGQLTGGVAHDFNNLLTVITNNADLLTQPSLDEMARRKLVDGIQRAAERGARLTQQLLAFARRQPLRPQIHSVRALIGNFEAVLRRGVGEAVAFGIALDKALDYTLIDAPQFEAALLNLVVNARDAMADRGTITIKSTVERIEKPPPQLADLLPREYVVLSVSDTGTGMSPDILTRVFEPFFTTKEAGKGNGLGLSQVYGFMTQSGGRVHIDSKLGRGTQVTLYLPTDAAAQKRAAAQEKAAGADPAPTVLVVEDDADVLESTIGMLITLGFSVLTAGDGPTALNSLRREPRIDVLFTDVVMPRGMNGVELARQARALRPDIKVLLASGFPMSALSSEHGLTDEFAFIGKPYRWAELSDRLRALRAAS
ncbi:MAG TPA: PAS domain S-box protein [Stellaceae bacterium]|nr:PAS domain S-box protein [Stellaceae bacterium]